MITWSSDKEYFPHCFSIDKIILVAGFLKSKIYDRQLCILVIKHLLFLSKWIHVLACYSCLKRLEIATSFRMPIFSIDNHYQAPQLAKQAISVDFSHSGRKKLGCWISQGINVWVYLLFILSFEVSGNVCIWYVLAAMCYLSVSYQFMGHSQSMLFSIYRIFLFYLKMNIQCD